MTNQNGFGRGYLPKKHIHIKDKRKNNKQTSTRPPGSVVRAVRYKELGGEITNMKHINFACLYKNTESRFPALKVRKIPTFQNQAGSNSRLSQEFLNFKMSKRTNLIVPN